MGFIVWRCFGWWSWRELNPRPQAFVRQIYMLSVLFWISPGLPRRRTLQTRPVPYFLVPHQGTRRRTSWCKFPCSLEVFLPPCPAHQRAVARLTGL